MNSKRKDYLVTIRNENYDTVKEFKVNPKYASFVGCNYHLYIIIVVLLGMCGVLFKFNTMTENEIEKLKNSNSALTTENATVNKKCLELEYTLWGKKLHNVIGYYSVKPNSEINKDTLYSFLNEHSDVFMYPDIVYAQVVLESSAGKSSLYKASNNLIGMTYPTRRETTAIGKTDSGFAKYKNWQMCVLDRTLWDMVMFKGKSPSRDEYLRMLGNRYASDPNYVSRIKNIVDTDYNKR